MEEENFFNRFLKPKTPGEWTTLILMIVLVVFSLVFMFFAYTRWQHM